MVRHQKLFIALSLLFCIYIKLSKAILKGLLFLFYRLNIHANFVLDNRFSPGAYIAHKCKFFYMLYFQSNP